MDSQGDIANQRISDGGRRSTLWSHDVLVATVLTVLAIGFIGLAWVSGGVRSSPHLDVTKVVTTK